MDGSSDPDANEASPPTGEGDASSPGPNAGRWDRMRLHGDEAARAALIESFRPFARMVAATYYGRRITDEIEFEDYHQWALVAMIESVDRFDPAHGVKFETFASRRMHGRIVDGIESATERQRQIAVRRRLRQSRLDDVKAAALERRPGGNDPKDADLLGFLAEVGMGLAVSLMLEGTGMVEPAVAPSEQAQQRGYERTELQQVRRNLNSSIGQLTAQEQNVIRSHYLNDHAFDDIGARLQLSKGRISQIHRQALGKLRRILGEDHRHDALT